VQHLLVTQDFLPELGGAQRRSVGLARAYPEPMAVSTVAMRDAARYDRAEDYPIDRQPFSREGAGSLMHRAQWQRWVATRCRGRVHVLHAGGISVVGPIVWRTHRRLGIPYVVHVGADELDRARDRARHSRLARRRIRLVLGDAAGVVATTPRVASIAHELMVELGISDPTPVTATGVGAASVLFRPGRDSGSLRQRWGIRRAPIVLTVGRLAPNKGQDTGIEALAQLRNEFPNLRYVLVGEGTDEARLRNLAADLSVMDRVGFAGAMRDDELPEAYATSSIYLDASRAEAGATAGGHGFALVEAQATALPVVATDVGDARSLLRDGEAGILVEPDSAPAVAAAIAKLLRDAELRNGMGMSGREAVEGHMNWGRVVHDTAKFVRECVANG
jgi:phosphatidylinositol alpha-1,6-mannosyltransferase